jgi:hypothetical protein
VTSCIIERIVNCVGLTLRFTFRVWIRALYFSFSTTASERLSRAVLGGRGQDVISVIFVLGTSQRTRHHLGDHVIWNASGLHFFDAARASWAGVGWAAPRSERRLISAGSFFGLNQPRVVFTQAAQFLDAGGGSRHLAGLASSGFARDVVNLGVQGGAVTEQIPNVPLRLLKIMITCVVFIPPYLFTLRGCVPVTYASQLLAA